eukprot:CAMPEP_0176444028 /NCGR_PEP_ID=MMETSP0127-20121128/22806_1 /TAXON_ID=938130 /ORGANISM="Platyophrya macrostoma, Strain WH" /LENGTH=400 /DNA_ID=CAMNT_0017829433 /DNA_START=35 /DNA_END=1237 /DNA_ORIENTATION=-
MIKSVFAKAIRGNYASSFKYSTFSAKDLEITLTAEPKKKPAFDNNLKFGEASTDHMLEIVWNKEGGWGKPKITPFRNLEIHPFNTTLHYALSCFEGMKAYKDANKGTRLFRPDKNCERLQSSFTRLSFPQFDTAELQECIKQLVRVERDWVPEKDGFSLYIRPFGMSLTDKLGVRPADSVLLLVCCSPVGPYYPSGFKPIKLYVNEEHIRAAYGGSGHYKLGANYGPTVDISADAERKGYSQVLWITNGLVTEVGTSNFMVRWINEKGQDEVVTPPLDGLILPGVTRDSILTLLRAKPDIKVSERNFTIEELVKAASEKRVIEAFGCGTAAVVSPIKGLYFRGKEYTIPINEKVNAGDLTFELNKELQDIQYGRKPHPWSISVDDVAVRAGYGMRKAYST